MSGFFSANVTSPFPDQNALYDAAKVANAAQTYQSNQLHMQGQQIDLSNANMAQVGQAAAGLLSAYPDEASRAAAYPRVVGMLQSQGFALHAPAEYPGEGVLRSMVNQSIPAKDLYSSGVLTPPGLTDALARANAPPPGYGGTGATATPATTPPGSGATIGQRQNNPGNLTFAGQPGAQPGQGNRFASFPDMPTGVAATADQLAIYQQQHGINTVRGAVTRWVSDPKADLTSYIGDISKALGVGPDDKIDLTNPDVQAKFIQAQFPHESAGGGYVLNPADVAKGVQMAAANRGRAVQAPGTAIATTTPPTAQPGQPVPTQVAGPPMVSAAPGGPPAAQQPAPAAAAPAPRVDSPGAPAAAGLKYNLSSQGAPAGTILGYLPNGNAVLAGPEDTHVGITGWNADGTPIRGGAPAPASTAQPAPSTAQAQPRGQPGATPLPGTGVNSQQFQTALWKTQQAALLETQFPNSPAAKAKAAELRAEAALYMQADSVITLPDGTQISALTGKRSDAAKPLADYRETTPGSGIWVGGPGTEPKFQPPGRLIVTPGGDVYQTSSGGAHLLKPTDPAAVTALAQAQAAGKAAGEAAGKLPGQLADLGRNAGQAIGNIDYGISQIQKAKEGGINTGYFAPWLSTVGAIAKSIGGDAGAQLLGINPAAVGNVQTAQKTLAVVSGAILQQVLGPDSQVTDAKIQHFIHAQPGIETDPDALGRVLNWARSQFVYEREMAAQGMKDAKDTGTLSPGWQAKYFDEHGFAPVYNPTVGEMQQPDGSAPPRQAPASLTTAPINPAARTTGTVYSTPKGPMKWTGTGWLPVQ